MKKKALTKLEKLMKKEGFYQFRTMAERFKRGKGYAHKRVGTKFDTYSLYSIDKNGVNLLTEKISKPMLKHYKGIDRYLKTKKKKYITPLTRDLLKNDINLTKFLDNLGTKGYTSRKVIRLRKIVKNKRFWDKVRDDIGRSHYRHTHTNYDLIDKKKMSDFDVKTLRKFYSKK